MSNELKIDSAARAREVLHVSEACKVQLRTLSIAAAVEIALDYDARVLRVLRRRHFAKDFDFMRWQAMGIRPERPVTGLLQLVEISSPKQLAACTIDGVALGDLIDNAGDEVWVSVSYFWLDLGFGAENETSNE